MANNLVTFVVILVLCMFAVSVIMRKKLKAIDNDEKRAISASIAEQRAKLHKLIEQAHTNNNNNKEPKREFQTTVKSKVLAYRPASHGLPVNSLCGLSEIDP